MKADFVKLLQKAQKGKYAIPAFNFDTLEILKAIILGAEKQNAPVIVMVTHSAIKYMGIDYAKAILKIAVNNAKIPVVAFLDHCSDINFMLENVDNSFQAIMYDGSKLPLETNINGVQTAMTIAQNSQIALEAELGHVGGKEDDLNSDRNLITDLKELEKFLSNASVDALAISIGNSHGQYQKPVQLNFSVLEKIKAMIKDKNKNIPLVLHGSSGIPSDQVQTAIKNGICKVNFGTELKIAYAESLKKSLTETNLLFDARVFGSRAIAAVQEVVEKNIIMVKANNKA